MSPRPYLIVSGVVFFLFGLLHCLRLIRHTPVSFGGNEVPMRVSYVGLIVGWSLCAWALSLALKQGRSR